MSEYLTVVYKINDHDAFAPEFDRIHEAMRREGEQPWSVTALSRDHEMRRVELIMEALERYSDKYEVAEAIEEIWQSDPMAWSWETYEKDAA